MSKFDAFALEHPAEKIDTSAIDLGIQKVASFKTSDGEMFETLEEAQCHEIKRRLTDFWLKYTGLEKERVPIIVTAMAEHADKLRAILNVGVS